MKATERYFHTALFITCILHNATLTFKSVDVAIHMKVSKRCFYVALFNAVQEDVIKVYF